MRARRWLPALLAFGALAAPAAAQQIPDFDKVRTPLSPAFVILGVAPTTVDRPTAPSALASSLKSDFGQGVLPRAYAAEAAPYWWFSHPGLTMGTYERGGPASLYRNLTFSLAVSDSLPPAHAAGADTASFRRMGIGLRTTLVNGAPLDRSCALVIDGLAATVSGRIAAVVADSIAADPPLAGQPAALERIQRGALMDTRAALPPSQAAILSDSSVAACGEALSARRGLVADLALAAGLVAPDARARGARFSAAGLWLTPAWLGRNASLVGVLRGMWQELESDSSSFAADVGARGVYAWDRYAASTAEEASTSASCSGGRCGRGIEDEGVAFAERRFSHYLGG